MIVPLLGRLADGYGLGIIFWVIAGVPILALFLTFGLPFPQIDRKREASSF
jgi:hypothetical protein